MPELLPFRALRFNAASTDLSTVLAPPYDIISPPARLDLLARDRHNAVRLDLPADVGHGSAADYAAAADTLAAWRRDRILVKDDEPTLTVHEMSWLDAEGERASATGFFTRLKLEPFGPGSGVLPHERTLAGPKKDRYELLEATRLNTSPLVFLASSGPGRVAQAVARLTAGPADREATTADGVSHRLWIRDGSDGAAAALLELVGSEPITIADGHHRYETALAFSQDQARAGDDDDEPASRYVMALIYPIDGSPPALPTHRVIKDGPSGAGLIEIVAAFGDVETVNGVDALRAHMSSPVTFEAGETGTGRLGIYSAGTAVLLSVDSESIDAQLDAGLSAASRGLDVNALTVLIERAYGADPGTLAGEGRLSYVKNAADATGLVDDGIADTCFLLDLMPASAISSVAEAGEVMPQKSTYFNPKAPTGLLFSPLEW